MTQLKIETLDEETRELYQNLIKDQAAGKKILLEENIPEAELDAALTTNIVVSAEITIAELDKDHYTYVIAGKVAIAMEIDGWTLYKLVA